MAHPDIITSLCERFALREQHYKSVRYNETESPCEFSVLPADILGQVYEKFLGKTIRLTAGHQAKIEGKPEVRKAGGVYYPTPPTSTLSR